MAKLRSLGTYDYHSYSFSHLSSHLDSVQGMAELLSPITDGGKKVFQGHGMCQRQIFSKKFFFHLVFFRLQLLSLCPVLFFLGLFFLLPVEISKILEFDELRLE